MSIDEMKAELDMRGVDFTDCFSRGELLQRLVETRTLGRAKPEVIDQFNSIGSQAVELTEEEMEKAVAADGGLPGGMSAAMMKALTSDPKIMMMLKDPKMQDIMKSVMTGGPDAFKKYLSDPGKK
jgi:hypothetical protein